MSSSHKSTVRARQKAQSVADPESLVRFAELLKLRSLAPSTQAEYLRYLRKLAARVKRDPATLDEAAVRAHLLHLKDKHGYSPSSMRTACAAMRAFYGLHLGHDWKLFDLVRSPSIASQPAPVRTSLNTSPAMSCQPHRHQRRTHRRRHC